MRFKWLFKTTKTYARCLIWQDVFSETYSEYKIQSGLTLDSWFSQQNTSYNANSVKRGDCLLPIVSINDEPITQTEWFERRLKPSDVVRIYVEPNGPVAIGLGVLFAAAVYTYNELSAVETPASYNAEEVGSGTYNINAQGNRARLGSAATVPCGDFAFYPEYAAEPWSSYDENGDQWLHQIYGWAGLSELHDIIIGNTSAANYSGDIEYEYHAPGQTVDLFYTDVETSVEVGGSGGRAGIELIGAISGTTSGYSLVTNGDDTARLAALSPVILPGAFGGISGVVETIKQTKEFIYDLNNPFYIESQTSFAAAVTGQTTGDFNGETISNLSTTANFRVGSKVQISNAGTNSSTYRVGAKTGSSLTLLTESWNQPMLNTEAAVTFDYSVEQTIDGLYEVAEKLPNTFVRLVQIDANNVTSAPIIPAGEYSASIYGVNSSGEGPWTQEYIANGAGTSVNCLEYDLTFGGGLVQYQDNGDTNALSVSVEWNARNLLTSNEFVLAVNVTDENSHRFTRSFKHELPESGRWAVSSRRVTPNNDSTRIRDDVEWSALKAIHSENSQWPGFSIVAMRMRATNTLASLGQRKALFHQTHFHPVYDELTDTWANQTTSNPAWIAADIITNPDYGDGRSFDVIDTASFLAFAKRCDARDDKFRGAFDTGTKIDDAIRRVLAVGRGTLDQRGDKFYIVADGLQFIEMHGIGQPSIRKETFELNKRFVTSEDFDGVKVIYTNPHTWKEDEIELSLPHQNGDSLEELRLYGVADRRQAVRNGLYFLADKYYRNATVNFRTEMLGGLFKYLTPISVSHPLTDWGQSGRVLARDGLTLTLSKNLEWAQGEHYVALKGKNGKRSQMILATAGSSPDKVVLAEEPDVEFLPLHDNPNHIPAEYQFGLGEKFFASCLVTRTRQRDEFSIDVDAKIDSPRVHQFDVLESQLTNWSDNTSELTGLTAEALGDGKFLVSWLPITTELHGYKLAQGDDIINALASAIDLDSCCHKVVDIANGNIVQVTAYSEPDQQNLTWQAIWL